MNINNKLDYFFESIIAEKNFSLNSINAYKNDLIQLFKNKKDFDLKVISEEYLVDNLNLLKKKNISDRTIARKISCYKHFFKFAIEEKWIIKNPCIKLKSPKYLNKLPETLSIKEINLLLNSSKIADSKIINNIRNNTLLELIYGTGLRVSELVTIPLNAINKNSELFLIRGKGNKERLVPISRSAKRAINKWLKHRNKMSIKEKSKNINTCIMSYSAKFASNFYSPFRDGLGNLKNLGETDKKTYQLDFRNQNEAIKESLEDIYEGADIIMVKPAIYYLDIVNILKEKCLIPIAAYQVSGEYSMIKIAAEKNMINLKDTVLESLIGIKRSGADIIFSYFSKEVAQWLK